MKIKRIRLKDLRNEEWFNFFKEFKTFVEQTTPGALDIEALFVTFLNWYGKADDLLELVRKSAFTALMVEKDALRDNAYRGMSETVIAAKRHYDPVKRDAAERLATLINHYGNVADRPYNEETATIDNFIRDIGSKYANEIMTLDLAGWIAEIDRTNSEFEKAVLDRNKEYADNDNEMNMLEIRKKTDRLYLDIVERIEALSIIRADDATLAGFIKTLNANVERYLTSVNRRTGKKTDPQPDSGKNESS